MKISSKFHSPADGTIEVPDSEFFFKQKSESRSEPKPEQQGRLSAANDFRNIQRKVWFSENMTAKIPGGLVSL